MSSILDAVNKDAERAGKAPLGSDAAGSGSGGGNSPRPRRLLPAVAVVLVGLAVGALAARMFGGAEGEPESLLTDKVAARTAALRGAADGPARHAKAAKKGRRSADSSGVVARDTGGAGSDQRARGAGSRKKDRASGPERRAAGEAAEKASAATPDGPGAGQAATAAAPSVVKPGAPTPAVVAALPATAPGAALEAGAGEIQPPAVVVTPSVPSAAPPQVPASEGEEAGAETSPPPVAPPVDEAAAAASPADEGAGEAPAAQGAAADQPPIEPATPLEPAVIADDTVVEVPLSEADEIEAVVSEKPPGAPEVVLMFILWARNPDERMASVRVGSSSITIIHEGQFLEGMQVSSIHADAVDFLWTGSTFRVHVGPY